MNNKELEFLDHLLRSTDGEKIVIEYYECGLTLKEMFGVCGKHEQYKVAPGFYVYEEVDWQISGEFEPAAVYLLTDSEQRLFYFSPKF